MGWPAVLRCALVCTLAACGGTKPSGSIGNSAPLRQHDLTASYMCSIESEGFRYPRFPCAVRSVDGRYVLAKLAGSQRFRGEVRPLGEGFTFEGEFYCPFGDCTSPMRGEFVRRPNGVLVGRFEAPRIVVTLEPTNHGAHGGAAYGGDSYGGDSYGGFGYGGWGYGGSSYGLQIPRSNRR